MTLSTLVLNIGFWAIIATLIVGFGFKKHKHWVMTFLQNFTGILFIFSGWVKAVDPLGTAYKMEQYFGEFESTFQDTWVSFIAPIFPALSDMSIGFSVFMIVLEIVLGLALIMGYKGKLTSWLFLIIVIFFTILTGFTFLTGYVPEGQNFFDFGSWGAYKASNMKVTDCGCFGDFLKLEPRISFFKDIVLLVPAIYFVFKHKDMHQLFTNKIRKIILGVSTIGLLLYCFSNYKWDIPHMDFRPFKKGAEVAKIKEAEEDAMANVDIVAWILENKETKEKKRMLNAEYMKQFSELKADNWVVVEQEKTEPTIPKTKISDFEISDLKGNDVSYEFLDNEHPVLMVVSHKLKSEAIKKTRTIIDSIYTMDTLLVADTNEAQIIKRAVGAEEREETYYDYIWDDSVLESYKTKIKKLMDEAKAEGVETIIVIGGVDQLMVDDFIADSGVETTYYTADDILLKTIVRSNPGVVLWKDGTILDKWHINKLPDYSEIDAKYFR